MPTNLSKRSLIDRPNDVGLMMAPIIILLAVLAAATYEPTLGRWISDAAQAEFVGPDSSILIAEANPLSPQVALAVSRR